MKMKAVIIDDEQPARELIKTYLGSFSEIAVVAECSNGFDGFKAIQEECPDLVFLDVQMPKISGFEMLELLENYPAVIFSTAYDEYALKAFEMNAADYLLKPYSLDRFIKAVEKALVLIRDARASGDVLKRVAASRSEMDEKVDRIVVKTGNKIKVIPVGQIEYLEADDDYVMIYTGEGRFLKQQRMKYFETHLDPTQFIRIHRSYIVRIDQILQIEPYDKDTKVVVLKNGRKLKASKTGLKTLRDRLGF